MQMNDWSNRVSGIQLINVVVYVILSSDLDLINILSYHMFIRCVFVCVYTTERKQNYHT